MRDSEVSIFVGAVAVAPMTLGRGEIVRGEYLDEPYVEYTISRNHYLLGSILKCFNVIGMCDVGARGLWIILQ